MRLTCCFWRRGGIPQLCKLIDPASTFTMPALFDPLNDTMAIMVGSLVLGGIQVFTGMTVSVVDMLRSRRASPHDPAVQTKADA